MTAFLEGLSQMKLEGEIQEDTVDIHVRNLPWGWEKEHIEAMLLESYPPISSVVVFSRKDSIKSGGYFSGFCRNGSRRNFFKCFRKNSDEILKSSQK